MKVLFGGRSLDVQPGETLLDCFDRHGAAISSACRSGACGSCLVQATAGAVPARAQVGLKPAWRAQGYLLACQCRPTEDLEVKLCYDAADFESTVERVGKLADEILGVWLRKPPGFHFEAGQFIHVVRPDDRLTRAYSIATPPASDVIELHVAVLQDGRMSQWLSRAEGQRVLVRGPFGECIYLKGDPDQPILLAGTGTGLAPLLGVLRAAVGAGHQGPIRLYHGALQAAGLYGRGMLRELARAHSNVQVIYSVLEEEDEGPYTGMRLQRLDHAILADVPNFAGWRAYLCGDPDTVQRLKKKLYLSGASLDMIHSDVFVDSAPPSSRAAGNA